MAEAHARAAGRPPRERIVIKPHRGWLAVNWRELWQHRELLYFLTWRDIKVRYKQTVLGALWAVLQPFAAMVVLTIIFQKVLGVEQKLMGAEAGKVPYAVLLYAGMLPWQFFRKAVGRSSTSLVSDAPLISKVYFPRLIIPIASVGSAVVDFLLSLIVLVGIMAYYRIMPGAKALAVVPLACAVPVAALGVGSLLGALEVAYRDARYVLNFVLSMWYFITPVLWSYNVLADTWWRPLVALNPICGILEAFRSALLPGRPFNWTALAISLGSAVVLFLVGLHCFRRLERQFADVI